MKNEEYVYRQDVSERAKTARSARNKRGHCGKGGRVRLPSDYMTKKELQKMNGECETYRLNEPMSWEEFKRMPDEHKITYIKLLRNKWNVPDKALAEEMFKCHPYTVNREVIRLGISCGQRSGRIKWDKEGYLAWLHGVPAELPAVAVEEPVEVVDEAAEEKAEVKVYPVPVLNPIVPTMGDVQYEGRIEDILLSVGALLNGANVSLYVKWMVKEEDDG